MLPAINAPKDTPDNNTLITAIDEPTKNSNIKIGGKKYQVYVIEDAVPPTSFPSEELHASLPSTV